MGQLVADSIFHPDGKVTVFPDSYAPNAGSALIDNGPHPTIPNTRLSTWTPRAALFDPIVGPASATDYFAGDKTWKAIPVATPAGSGSELQYKSGVTFGAVPGSSVSGSSVTLGGLNVNGTGTLGLPSGTTLQRVAIQGIRWNTDTTRHEFFNPSNATWYNHARLSGDTFTGAIAATNLSGTNTGDTPPGGSGTELQFRSGSSFGALTGSSVSGANVTLGGTITLVDAVISRAGSQIVNIGTGGQIRPNGTNFLGTLTITNNIGSAGVQLAIDALDVLAQRNGTNAQTFGIYNTYTSSTNNELLRIKAASTEYQIGSAGGSAGGVNRDLKFGIFNPTTQAFTSQLAISASNGDLTQVTSAALINNGYIQSPVLTTTDATCRIDSNGINCGSGRTFGISSAANPNAAARDVQFARNGTGPKWDILADGGARFRNLANSADAPITASTLTLNGITAASVVPIDIQVDSLSVFKSLPTGTYSASAGQGVFKFTARTPHGQVIELDPRGATGQGEITGVGILRTTGNGFTVKNPTSDILAISSTGVATFSSYTTSAFQTLTVDPISSDIPAGSIRVVKNTTLNEIRLWANDGGSMKKSAALA